MRNWETSGDDPVAKQITAERIKNEIEKRIKEASNIKDLNRYMIEEHERIKRQELDQKRLTAE